MFTPSPNRQHFRINNNNGYLTNLHTILRQTVRQLQKTSAQSQSKTRYVMTKGVKNVGKMKV